MLSVFAGYDKGSSAIISWTSCQLCVHTAADQKA